MTPLLCPPDPFTGEPERYILPQGSLVARVHGANRQACEFNPTKRSGIAGGRFDAREDADFDYLYVAADSHAAISEKFLRDAASETEETRILPQSRVAKQVINWMKTTAETVLVDLRTPASLEAIGQDEWLTRCDAIHYPITRKWCESLRDTAPWAHGFTWMSRFDPTRQSYVFFGDRCTEQPFEMARSNTPLPIGKRELWHGEGREYLVEILDEYGVVVSWQTP